MEMKLMSNITTIVSLPNLATKIDALGEKVS